MYGVGGLLIMYLLQPWAHTWIPLFFASMVIVSVVEYFTSWILEVLFHTRWWDYSKEKFNLHGRIFLGGAICFGLMGTLIAHFLHPWLESKIFSIPLQTARLVAWILFAILMVDLITTLHGLVNFTLYQTRLKEFAEFVERGFDQEWIKEKEAALKQQEEKMLRHIKKFPSMTSTEFHKGIAALRQRMQQEQK